MLHGGDGTVVCDIVGHVVGERLDLGHGVAHGDSRLDGSEHAQVVARIAESQRCDISLAAQIRQRSRHAHALVDALGAQLAILATGVAGLEIVLDRPSSLATRAKLGTLRHTLPTRRLPSTRISSAAYHRSADQRRLLNTRGFQGKEVNVGLEKGLNPCRGHTACKLLDNVLVNSSPRVPRGPRPRAWLPSPNGERSR